MFLAQSGLIGGMYAALCLIFSAVSYGPIQIRVAEALGALALFTPAAVPGLAVGCLVADLFGGGIAGVFDWAIGSLTTLLAAALTYRMRRLPPAVAMIPPVVLNALTVGAEIALAGAEGFSWSLFVLYAAQVAAGQAVACIGGGCLLTALLKKTGAHRLFSLQK